MLTPSHIAQIEERWDVTVLDWRADYDATTQTGFPTACVAVDGKYPGTMYVVLDEGEASLAWDVSGFPSWYTE